MMYRKLDRLIKTLSPGVINDSCDKSLKQGDYYTYENGVYVVAMDHSCRWVFINIENGGCLGDRELSTRHTPTSPRDITTVGYRFTKVIMHKEGC